jgi:hypothetical protein
LRSTSTSASSSAVSTSSSRIVDRPNIAPPIRLDQEENEKNGNEASLTHSSRRTPTVAARPNNNSSNSFVSEDKVLAANERRRRGMPGWVQPVLIVLLVLMLIPYNVAFQKWMNGEYDK